ncbi:hypothetical protein SSX86_030519 [Deinandra increscens subsp. villosa]|uniref:Protein kinase domain-containing protein n=1 Tax=Deinandra increscens subsp. villosa TaxID=3103831 RepID=A0AAP0C703_9ASTR
MEKWEHLRIPLADIVHATNGFQKEIGRGGYGSVYEGELDFNGKLTKIAVKKLNETHGQGLKEFLTEIDLLSGQQHENIITLIGYCDEGKEMIIVYEHAEHGSLDRYIRCSNTTGYTLTWLERLRIVVGAARGLDHLHNHLHNNQVIIHRDIKSSNILLDQSWVAKISDLGLSKSTFSGFGRTTVVSHACGTSGYVEPEYIHYGLVSRKSDVYSFGMVLFEVLCGRLCTIRGNDGILLLADVAKEHFRDNKLDMLIDSSLRKQMSQHVLGRYSTIAYKCLLGRNDRPSIVNVKKELEETLNLEVSTIY